MIEEEIAAIVGEVAEIDPASVVRGGTLAEGGVDSLMAVEIAVEVERRYGVRFTEDDLKQVTSFEGLVRLTKVTLAKRRP